MATYYTNNPSRFGGCYATHDPTASQASASTPVTPVLTTAAPNFVGGKRRAYKFTPFHPGRLEAETAIQKAMREALVKAGTDAIEVTEAPIDPRETSVTFDQPVDSAIPGLAEKIAGFEAVANEIEAKTRARLGILEQAQLDMEEHALILLLAQDI